MPYWYALTKLGELHGSQLLLREGVVVGALPTLGFAMWFSPGESSTLSESIGSGIEKEGPQEGKCVMDVGQQREVIQIPKTNGFAHCPADPREPPNGPPHGTFSRGPISTYQPFRNFFHGYGTQKKFKRKRDEDQRVAWSEAHTVLLPSPGEEGGRNPSLTLHATSLRLGAEDLIAFYH